MIVSYELGVIFVKTRKTAGTSVEIALSRHCGPRDIITPISPADEELRASVGGRGPQNHTISRRRVRRLAESPFSKDERPRFYNHMPAASARAVLGKDVWDTFRTFTVERNPWDRLVSMYFYNNPTLSPRAFPAWLHKLPPHVLSNYSIYGHETDGLLVDRFLQYDRGIQHEVAATFEKLGLELDSLPRAKSNTRPREAVDYRTMYADADVEFVEQACRREIELFGFQFDKAMQPAS